jgi:hypothetical protein
LETLSNQDACRQRDLTFGSFPINTVLDIHWQMMGALEALNGIILFGLTTAFMFAILQRASLNGPGSDRP